MKMEREEKLVNTQGKTRELVLFSLFTALTAIGAFIRVPVPLCPFTLQLLFTTLAGLILGSKKGAASVAVYVALGLAGVPVFTQGGGPGYIFQPTFGYLLGFIAGAWFMGKIGENDMFQFIHLFFQCFIDFRIAMPEQIAPPGGNNIQIFFSVRSIQIDPFPMVNDDRRKYFIIFHLHGRMPYIFFIFRLPIDCFSHLYLLYTPLILLAFSFLSFYS